MNPPSCTVFLQGPPLSCGLSGQEAEVEQSPKALMWPCRSCDAIPLARLLITLSVGMMTCLCSLLSSSNVRPLSPYVHYNLCLEGPASVPTPPLSLLLTNSDHPPRFRGSMITLGTAPLACWLAECGLHSLFPRCHPQVSLFPTLSQ